MFMLQSDKIMVKKKGIKYDSAYVKVNIIKVKPGLGSGLVRVLVFFIPLFKFFIMLFYYLVI